MPQWNAESALPRAGHPQGLQFSTVKSATRTVLDSEERYEDSYAVTQEFREWITCMGEDQSLLDENTLVVPRNPSKRYRLVDGLAGDLGAEA